MSAEQGRVSRARSSQLGRAASARSRARWRSRSAGSWLLGLTVLAPALTEADAAATAAFALGEEGVAWAAARTGCEVFAVDAGRRVVRTAGVPVAEAGRRPSAPEENRSTHKPGTAGSHRATGTVPPRS